MQDQKTGYVALTFAEDVKQRIIQWSKQFDESFFSAVVDGKTEGGNVTNKLHLTLFYGFNEEQFDKAELLGFLTGLKLDPLSIEGVGTFPVPQYNAKVLFLRVKDDGKLKEAHEKLKTYPFFEEYQKYGFTPHITIGFVRDTFDESSITYDGPSTLPVANVVYYSKGDREGFED
ncbi:2'-5' RNA ligase family protein [Patescibacteria group bacterium]|nr:2'-5' RNA ligase family protein [Patescibacteria group bacterium]